MKFATCTPVCFDGEPRFFTRDTGLLCRGFQAAGLDCVVVMPGKKRADEPPDLIRCPPEHLANSGWWRNTGLDVVVLYAWGDPRYLPVARAIRSAGIHLIQSLDTAGLYSPHADFRLWFDATIAELCIPQSLFTRLRRLARVGRDFIPSLYERQRLDMMSECDRLAAVSPPALETIASYATGLGRPEVAAKLMVIPHAVSPAMAYHGEQKRKTILAVGRWGGADSAQKDPALTLQVVARFLGEKPDWSAEIIGPEALGLENSTSRLESSIRSRIGLRNFIAHDELRRLYAESSILLCASRFESFHIASAEAVCCGCSIVVADHPLLASTGWFAGEKSGSIAPKRTLQDLANTLAHEASLVECNDRNPHLMSQRWMPVLHADRIASGIRNLPEFR